MNLLVDIGNTRMRWAISASPGCVDAPGITRHRGRVWDEVLRVLDETAHVRRVLVASVAGGEAGEALARYTTRRWGIRPELLQTPVSGFGIAVAYCEPQRLGVDRFVAMVAAHAQVGGPVLVMDAGTAVTLDAVDSSGLHLGGLIVPGLSSMYTMLTESTHRVSVVGDDDASLFATDTAGAVGSGSRHALAALAERAFDELARTTGEAPQLILTGGDADRLVSVIRRDPVIVPDLTLMGLSIVAGSR